MSSEAEVRPFRVEFPEAEVAEFRRFRSLTGKLVEVNRAVCRLRPVEEPVLDAQEKKRPKRSKRKSPAK